MPTARVEATDGKLYIHTPFNASLNVDLKKIPTHWWSKAHNAWEFDRTPAISKQLRDVLTRRRYNIVNDDLLVMRREKVAPITLKHRDPQPWEHQIPGIRMIGEMEAVCIDGGMGTGKTRMVIDAMTNYNLKRVLILCPSSVVSVWPTEVLKYAGDDIRVVALRDGTIQKRTDYADKIMAQCAAAPSGGGLVMFVINFEAAWRAPFADWAKVMKWDRVIFDEIHRLKAHKGKQSKFCADLSRSANGAVGLSGTLMPHGPADIFAEFRALDPGIYGTSFTKFKLKYITPATFEVREDPEQSKILQTALTNDEDFKEIHEGRKKFKSGAARMMSIVIRGLRYQMTDQEIVDTLELSTPPEGEKKIGYKVTIYAKILSLAKKRLGYPETSQYQNLDEFKDLMDTITLHISRDVLDLPDVMDVTRDVILSKPERKLHDQLYRDLVAWVQSGEQVTAANALVKILKLQQATSGYAKDDDGNIHVVGESRAKALSEILEDAGVPGGEAVVVFCRFHHDLDAIHKVCKGLEVASLELSGRVNQLAEWQEDNSAPVLAVQIQSGGVGVDMTRARYGVYYSIGYSLGELDQAKARYHRPGQTRKVTNIFMIAGQTIDEGIYSSLRDKRSVVDFVMSLGRKEKRPAK